MISGWQQRALLGLMIFVLPLVAHAGIYGLFPMGPDCKAAAMDSSTGCDGSARVFYNPGALITSSAKPSDHLIDAELGHGTIQYGYEHPDFDLVDLQTSSPVASLGWRQRTSWDIDVGAALFPTLNSHVNIPGLPRRLSGKMYALDVESERQQAHLALGASYRGIEKLGLGLSLIATYEKRGLRGKPVGSDAELVDLQGKTFFMRPLVGVYYELNENVSLGTSYLFAHVRRFDGTTKLAGDSFDTRLIEYDPAVLLLSSSFSSGFGKQTLSYNQLFGKSGADKPRDGLNPKATSAELQNAGQWGLRFESPDFHGNVLGFGVAQINSIYGPGHFTENADGSIDHELGVGYGNFDALPYFSVGANLQHRFVPLADAKPWYQSLKGLFALQYLNGRKEVGLKGDQPGRYQLALFVASMGLEATL